MIRVADMLTEFSVQMMTQTGKPALHSVILQNDAFERALFDVGYKLAPGTKLEDVTYFVMYTKAGALEVHRK